MVDKVEDNMGERMAETEEKFMPITSLYEFARRSCIMNIHSITDVGDIPYDFIKHIISKIQNPEQLRELEKNSPQLVGKTGDLWRAFIKRDVLSGAHSTVEPKNPESWYKLYQKLCKEEEQVVEDAAASLRTAMEGLRNEKAKHTSLVVDPRTVPRLPRMGGMRPEGGRTRGTASVNNSSTLKFTSGSKTKTLTGRGVMERAKREAKEMSLFTGKRGVLSVPTHMLSDRATQVRKVPQGLVEEHLRPVIKERESMGGSSKPSATTTTIRAPRRIHTRPEPRRPLNTGAMSTPEREQRQNAYTTPTSSTKSNTSRPSSTLDNINYHIPSLKPQSSDGQSPRPPPLRKRPEVDIFMPAKRRKLNK